ncbi:MAG: ABC transporter ATP-binding protein [Rhodocyclaceae bacterium]|nr:ABC transporter ATP-binding protein [Rhodocyclaceae bacterium]
MSTALAVAEDRGFDAPPIVRFASVRKIFAVNGGELEAIRAFDLDIHEGESVAIVGSSGCGKSTLLRLLVGLDRNFEGSIRIDDRPVRGIGSECGIVFQEHRLFPWLTVADNIALGLASAAVDKAERHRQVERLVRLVGLDGFQKAYPHQLSGGMAQRVAIARGLVVDPRILLLDEPFGALDALTRQQMQEELLAVRERADITMLLVTHDVEEAVFLADRVVVLAPRPGRIRRVFQVGLPYPRNRGGLEFHRLREAILHELTHAAPEPAAFPSGNVKPVA